eukprot:g78721.t1
MTLPHFLQDRTREQTRGVVPRQEDFFQTQRYWSACCGCSVSVWWPTCCRIKRKIFGGTRKPMCLEARNCAPVSARPIDLVTVEVVFDFLEHHKFSCKTNSWIQYSEEEMDEEHVFRDLTSRFFINVPTEEFDSFQRLFFQLEQAYWFYEDFYVSRYSNLKRQKLKDFCLAFFQHCPFLEHLLPRFEKLFRRFVKYVGEVPVAGCILLSKGHRSVLMIQGNSKNKYWGFPKGKLDHNETNADCAAREVMEEVGFPVDAKQLSDENSILSSVRGRVIRLYVVPDVDTNFEFKTSTRGEINNMRWWNVNELASSSDVGSGYRAGGSMEMVKPFVDGLRRWIRSNPPVAPITPRHLHVNTEPVTTTRHVPVKAEGEKTGKSPRRRRGVRSHGSSASAQGSVSSSDDDDSVQDTFGEAQGGWAVEEMFRVNAELGVRSAGNFQEPISDEERQSFRAWLRGEGETPTARNGVPVQEHGNGKAKRNSRRRKNAKEAAMFSTFSDFSKSQGAEMPSFDPVYDAAYNAAASTVVPAPIYNFQFDSSQIMMAFSS